MDYKKDEQVIFVKDLFFAALYQWRRIMIWAVVFAILLGGLSAVFQLRSTSDKAAVEAAYKTASEYNKKKENLTNKINLIKNNISKQYTYLEESPLMQLDSTNVYQGTITVAVPTIPTAPGTDYKLEPDYVTSILSAYRTALSTTEIMNAAAEAMGVDPRFVWELIGYDNGGEYSRLLIITVSHATEEGVQKVLDLFMDSVEAAEDRVHSYIENPPAVSIVKSTVSPRVATAIQDKQNAAKTLLLNLENELTAAENAKKTLLASPVSLPIFSKKKVVIFAFLGAVLGAIMVVGFACLKHIAGGWVYSARTLRNRTGLKILGCLPSENKAKGIDLWLKKLEGRALVAEKLPVIAATVRNCTPGKKLLIVGEGDATYQEAIAQAMNKFDLQIQVGGNLLCQADALEALPDCDAVLLVECCGTSRYANVLEAMDRINDLNKPLVGCVLYEG